MIKFVNIKPKAHRSVAEALAVSKLSKYHAKELFPTTEVFCSIVPIVSINASFKDIVGSKLDKLCKYYLALIHAGSFAQRKAKPISNRRQPKNSANVD